MKTGRIINKNRLLSFSAVLSILVVLIHTENLASFNILPEASAFHSFVYYFERFISGNIAKIGVPSFFMVSGILFYRDFKMTMYTKKMKNRFFSLVIPFLLWNILRFLLFFVLGKISFCTDVLGINPIPFTLKNVFMATFFYKYNLGYWFMYQLILYTIFSPVIYLALKKKPIAIISLLAVLVLYSTDALGGILVNVFHNKFLQIDGLFYYMFGAFIGMHYFDFVNRESKNIRRFALFGVLLGQACFHIFYVYGYLVFHILFCAISSVSFWYLLGAFKENPLPLKITTITFFIYSAHGTVLELLEMLVRVVIPQTALFALIEYLILPLATIFILIGASLVLKRFTPFVWKMLNGSR